MKKQSKSIQKQARREQDRRRHREAERKHRQAAEQAEVQLWNELDPLAQGYDLDDDDGFIEFASQMMHDSAGLFEEPEFHDLAFDPAEVMLLEMGSFNATVPAPEKLEQLPEEEHQGLLEDAQVRAVSRLVTPGFQRNLLTRFKQCRQRLRRERKAKQLALASATEMLLRNDSRPIIWATCGMLHMAFGAALETAFEFQEAEVQALHAAQAIQPDIADVADLKEGTPAYRAFWEAAGKTSGLTEYLERIEEMSAIVFEMQRDLNIQLGVELFEPEEIENLVHALTASLKAQGVNLGSARDERSKPPISESTLADVIKAKLPPERFRKITDDLDRLIEEGDEMDEIVQRARVLRDDFGESDLPYWENHTVQQLCLDVMVADVFDSGDEGQDDENA